MCFTIRNQAVAVVVRFLAVVVALVMVAGAQVASATDYYVRDWRTYDDVLSELAESGVKVAPREKDSFFEYFFIPFDSDIRIHFDQYGELIAFQTHYTYTSGEGRTSYTPGWQNGGTCNIEVAEAGGGYGVMARSLWENADGEELTVDFFNQRSFACKYVYRRYAKGTEIDNYILCAPLNLGNDWSHVRIVERDAPTPAQLATQMAIYQEALARKMTGRSFSLEDIIAELNLSDSNGIELDKDGLPIVWQPSVRRSGQWVYLTDYVEQVRVRKGETDKWYPAVDIWIDNNELTMIDEVYDPIYDQLLDSHYGKGQHFTLSSQQEYWLAFGSGSGVLTRPTFPADLTVIRLDDSHYVNRLDSNTMYVVAAKQLLEDGLILGSDSLEERIRLIAAPLDKMAAHYGEDEEVVVTVRLTIDGVLRQAYLFVCASERLQLPANEIFAVNPQADRQFKIGDNTFDGIYKLEDEDGIVTLESTDGKCIGALMLIEKSQSEKLTRLEKAGDLSAADQQLLDQLLDDNVDTEDDDADSEDELD